MLLFQGRNGSWEGARTGIAKPAVEKAGGGEGPGGRQGMGWPRG